MSNIQNNKAFSVIADIDGDILDLLNVDFPNEIPILPVRNLVIFPGVVSPILIGRDSSARLVRKAEKNESVIGIVCQRNPEIEEPTFEDLYPYGVYAKVVKLLTLPNGAVTIIVQGLGRLRLKAITSELPFLTGQVESMPEIFPDKRDNEWRTAVKDLRNMADEYITITDEIPDEATFAIKNINNDIMALNFVCSNMPFSIKEKVKMLGFESIKERLFAAMKALNREINLQHLKADIRNKTREDIDEQQKNYFLQQQIKNIQAEIGNETSPGKAELLQKAAKKKWPQDVADYFSKEADKLDNQSPQSPEYNLQLTYLQTMVALPWGEYTKDNLDLKRAQRILDHDHYGMEKVKERILEYMAVLARRYCASMDLRE